MIRRIIFSTLIAVLILITSLFIRIAYPSSFTNQEVFLAQGMVPSQIAYTLQQNGIVRSAFSLRVILKLRGTAGELVPGEYLFEKRESLFKVASRITKGDFQMEQKKVTIPEGSTNVEITEAIGKVFADFDKKTFLARAEGKQGYLFPETYRFLSTSTTKILAELSDTFDYQVRDLQSEAIGEGKKWENIVIMASILEEEANTVEDFKIISGILWKRFSIGMALQVDASPITYERPGFPPSPLSNPGLVTLDAALHPASSTYTYYLTGKDGLMHYAETYAQHQKNIKTYLK